MEAALVLNSKHADSFRPFYANTNKILCCDDADENNNNIVQ